jgi:hypothetical protein
VEGASALPHSSQNLEVGLLSVVHFGQRLDSGVPHSAQNFPLLELSVPHFVQRIGPIPRDTDECYFVSSNVTQRPANRGKAIRDMWRPDLWNIWASTGLRTS